MKRIRNSTWASYVFIFLGVCVCVIGLNFFLVPANIAPGGFSGIAAILYYWLELPIGLTMLALNIPLFVVSFTRVSRSFALRSLFALVLFSVLADAVPKVALSDDKLLSAVYGGALMGVGLSAAVYFGGSTGGSDLLAILVNKLLNSMSLGVILFIIDGIVIAASALVFDIKAALFALISAFITIKVIGVITEGVPTGRAFFIISNKSRDIKEVILIKMRRGVTELYARGGYGGKELPVLLCTVERGREAMVLKKTVAEIDKNAFLIAWDAKEVLGEGFSIQQKDDGDRYAFNKKCKDTDND